MDGGEGGGFVSVRKGWRRIGAHTQYRSTDSEEKQSVFMVLKRRDKAGDVCLYMWSEQRNRDEERRLFSCVSSRHESDCYGWKHTHTHTLFVFLQLHTDTHSSSSLCCFFGLIL